MSVAVDEQSFWLGDWRVEPPLNRIVRGEEIIRIDPRNMKVLQLLASQPGHVFSQAEIEQAVWSDVIVTSNSVYQSIAQLRRALGDEKRASRFIETIPRRGYRIIAPIGPCAQEERSPSMPSSHDRTPRLDKHLRVISVALLTIVVIGSLALLRNSVHTASQRAPSKENDVLRLRFGDDHSESVVNKAPRRLLEDLAYAALSQGNWRNARSYLLQALQIERDRVGSRHPRVGSLLSELANVAVWSYDYGAAERYARDALAAFEGMPDAHPERIVAMRQVGYTLLESGKYAEAEPHLLRALELSRQAFSDTEWNTAAVLLSDLSALRYSQGRLEEAEELIRNSIKLLHEIFDDEMRISNASTLLATILVAQHRYQEAKVEAEKALTILRPLFAEDHVYIIATRDVLGKSLIGLGEYVAAEDILRRNVDLWRRTEGANQRGAASLSALGEALLRQGRIVEAEECLDRASAAINGTSMAREEQQWFREHKERLDRLQLVRAQLTNDGAQLAEVEGP